MKSPKLTQGIFSGVSSSFEPIGNGVVTIKAQSEFEDLSPIEVKKSRGTQKEEHINPLFQYFESKEGNNLSTNRSTSFSLKDLIE